MPETAWAVNGYPPDSSRGSLTTPVSISSDLISTRQRQRALAHRSSSRTSPDAIQPRLFPRRSPQRSSANAARGGLEPLPAERLRRANNLHLSHSTALSEAPSLPPPALVFTIKPLSTVRRSPASSDPSRTPMFSAGHSLLTTTTTTGTPASRCTLPRPCTTAPGPRYRTAAPPPSAPPTRRTRNGSAATARSRRPCPPRCGSTSRPPPSRPADHHKQRKQPDVSISLTGSAALTRGAEVMDQIFS